MVMPFWSKEPVIVTDTNDFPPNWSRKLVHFRHCSDDGVRPCSNESDQDTVCAGDSQAIKIEIRSTKFRIPDGMRVVIRALTSD
jgi:hypothetical protein